ncbi:hypothetical protein [Devosia ginsengisoli]|uniref:hypothetical protein n=1 Tax=Devosia ginsengisoli TaxID=400770 RepID=UPI0026EB4C58|nr:hypothetical protein [Devosia ginsengisoli]MCR6672215.1 hypothetical protein [Devosia ginsengisoli]
MARFPLGRHLPEIDQNVLDGFTGGQRFLGASRIPVQAFAMIVVHRLSAPDDQLIHLLR